MAEIQAIDKHAVHQICSGQVILNLATAIKELLENSLDAGATSVDIKLKEYGSTQIEVIDNGCGVEEKNFKGLTLKHHTSKLQDFLDLTSVETFGFRGEALSSLCALCKLTITTRYKSTKVAHKIEYDRNGDILKQTRVARQPGTSVVLSDIFYTLPVRYREFKKNIKKEYNKLLSLLNGYCLICTDIRISCSNETDKGNRSTVLSTSGAKTVIDNISSVFGSKQCTNLKVFKQLPPSLEVCETFLLKHDQVVSLSQKCTITGYISSCGPGLGRASGDRQFYSINKRPCELPKVTKIVNEVFHMFNRYQYPFVQLDISTNREEVDVNVTPDKRQIFMEQEKLILAIIKTSILALFSEGQHAIGGLSNPSKCSLTEKKGGFHCVKPISLSQEDMNIKTEEKFDINKLKISIRSQLPSKLENHKILSPLNQPASLHRFISSTQMKGVKRSAQITHCSPHAKQPKIESALMTTSCKLSKVEFCNLDMQSSILKTKLSMDKNDSSVDDQANEDDDEISLPKSNSESCNIIMDDPHEGNRKCHNIKYSFASMKVSLCARKRLTKSQADSNYRSFKARICSEQNNQAEAELRKYFNKESFQNSIVLGQFNLGFVITRHENDLFIIDQHAADEKYNFEKLQKETHLHGQLLIIPQKLELTAGERLVVEENIEIFERNGFAFKIKKDEKSQQESIYLTKVPSSKNWTFDASDVAELIFMLTDAPSILCRPSSVRKMFASRACRKSVMIGTALTSKEMKRIVNHMEEMEHPWNCPHGRPTMRHLVDLSMINTLNK